jgi:hypothetical protein
MQPSPNSRMSKPLTATIRLRFLHRATSANIGNPSFVCLTGIGRLMAPVLLQWRSLYFRY